MSQEKKILFRCAFFWLTSFLNLSLVYTWSGPSLIFERRQVITFSGNIPRGYRLYLMKLGSVFRLVLTSEGPATGGD